MNQNNEIQYEPNPMQDSMAHSYSDYESESNDANFNTVFNQQFNNSLNRFLDKAKVNSSTILENINYFSLIPNVKKEDEDEYLDNVGEFSPLTPTNFNEKFKSEKFQKKITPDLLRRISSSEFGEINEGDLKKIADHINVYNDSKLTKDKGLPFHSNRNQGDAKPSIQNAANRYSLTE